MNRVYYAMVSIDTTLVQWIGLFTCGLLAW
jgi:hypothetical protein